MEQVAVRMAEEPDFNFVLQSWLRTYKNSSSFAKRIRNDVYFARHPLILERILKRSRCFVAVLKDAPETILGYLVTENVDGKPVLHFCYCKKAFRGWGVATTLFMRAGLDPNACMYTHRTSDVDWLEKKFPDMIYDPYLI